MSGGALECELRRFEPLFRNPDVLTILANLWPRRLDRAKFPVRSRIYQTEPEVRVRVEEQRPAGPAVGQFVLVHGLESSSEAGYMHSMAQAALAGGYVVHRMNLRSCGGTEHLCNTMYHAGLTGDLRVILEQIQDLRPIFVVGYSLGGNVAVKLAGELGDQGPLLVDGVCGACASIDLGACARQLAEPRNRFYERRFLLKLIERIRRRSRIMPERFSSDGLDSIRTLREFDDRVTAPAFGFRGADGYYGTQSALLFVKGIRVPVLLIPAKDDPIIPFGVFRDPAIGANPFVSVEPAEYGGHLGFVSRRRPRFWLDGEIVRWAGQLRNKSKARTVLP